MSSTVSLGTLELVDLRQAWPNEAVNFTPWLAEEANLRSLGDALGLQLRLERVEQPVDTFSADILARDLLTERWVLIENQLEQTDHSHLGQILTYAAGLDAQTVVWIARSFREPHRAAIDYLNRISGEEHNFFAVQIELYRIGNSPYAPRFNVVAKPNNWSKSVASTGSESAAGSTLRKEWVDYWTGFFPVATAMKLPLENRVPPREGWCRIAPLATGANTATVFAHRANDRVRALIWLQGTHPKELLSYLAVDRDSYEASIGQVMNWDIMNGRLSSMIAIETSASILGGSENEYRWMAEHTKKLIDAFQPAFQRLRNEKLIPGSVVSTAQGSEQPF